MKSQGDSLFSERLRAGMKKAGLSKVRLAEAASVSTGAMTEYVRGRIPQGAQLRAIAKALKVSTDWLLGLADEPTGAKESATAYPQEPPIVELRVAKTLKGPGKMGGTPFRGLPLVSGEIAAGAGAFAEDQLDPDDPYVLVPEHAVRGRSDLVAIRVRGKSMLPTMRDGAIVCIDRADRRITKSGIFAVRTEEGGATVKRLHAQKGALVLRPDNPEEPLQVIPLAEGEDPRDRIIGRVVWAWQAFV